MWFSWQTVEDIGPLLAEVGLRVLHLYGIGVLSGLKGDARGAIVHPALLSAEDQKSLMEVECAAAEQYAGCGRYMLTLAERPRAASASFGNRHTFTNQRWLPRKQVHRLAASC